MLIPLGSKHWEKTNFPFKWAPSYKFKKSQIKVISDDDLGGYAHKFKKEYKLTEKTRLKIAWQVKKFPKVSPRIPFVKKEDDYPIRIGLILSGGEKAKIPKSVLKKLPFKKTVSNILYYGPVRADKPMNYFCGDSPHNAYAVYCAVPSDYKEKLFEFMPLRDLIKVKKSSYQAEILGVWLFADTDDSESKSSVILKSIELLELK